MSALTFIILAVILSLSLLFARKIARKYRPVTFGQLHDMLAPLKEKMAGVRCWECGERYVGLALDCRCTDWGR